MKNIKIIISIAFIIILIFSNLTNTFAKSTFTSEDLDIDEIVNNWPQYGAKTWTMKNGELFSKTGGGFNKPAWWGTIILNPDGYDTIEYDCEFLMVSGGKLNEGACFDVTRNEDGSFNGYFMSISNHVNNECRLFKFTHYTLDQSFLSGINKQMWCGPLNQNFDFSSIDPSFGNSTNINSIKTWTVGNKTTEGKDSFTVLAGWTTGSSNIKYHILSKNGRIIIEANNQVVADVKDNTYTKGTFGFWGNNCEMSSYMYIKDINIKTKVYAKKIIITKLEKDTNKPIKESVIGLCDKNGNILKDKNGKEIKGTTDEKGEIDFAKITNIEPGTYYYKEIKAPEGYKNNNEIYSFVVDGEGKVTFDKANGKIYNEKNKEEKAIAKKETEIVKTVNENKTSNDVKKETAEPVTKTSTTSNVVKKDNTQSKTSLPKARKYFNRNLYNFLSNNNICNFL